MSLQGTLGLPQASETAIYSLIYLTENGQEVDGTSVQTSLTQPGDYTSVAFSVPIQISSVPTTLQIVSSQGGLLFSNISLSVVQLGDNPTN